MYTARPHWFLVFCNSGEMIYSQFDPINSARVSHAVDLQFHIGGRCFWNGLFCISYTSVLSHLQNYLLSNVSFEKTYSLLKNTAIVVALACVFTVCGGKRHAGWTRYRTIEAQTMYIECINSMSFSITLANKWLAIGHDLAINHHWICRKELRIYFVSLHFHYKRMHADARYDFWLFFRFDWPLWVQEICHSIEYAKKRLPFTTPWAHRNRTATLIEVTERRAVTAVRHLMVNPHVKRN